MRSLTAGPGPPYSKISNDNFRKLVDLWVRFGVLAREDATPLPDRSKLAASVLHYHCVGEPTSGGRQGEEGRAREDREDEKDKGRQEKTGRERMSCRGIASRGPGTGDEVFF